MKFKFYSLLLTFGLLFGYPSNPVNMRLVGTWPYGGEEVSHIEADGNENIFVSISGGVFVFQIQGNQVAKIAEIHIGNIINDIYYRNGKLFVSDIRGVTIWDVTSPDNPFQITSLSCEDAYGIASDDNYLYIVKPHGGLTIYNISNPASPSPVSSTNPGQFYDVEIVNHYLLATSPWNGSITKIDVTNPVNPQVVTTTYWSNDQAVKIYYPGGDYAFVASSGYGLVILDATQQDTVPIVGFLSTNDAASDVFVLGNRAFVANSWRGIDIIDISNPASPQIELEYSFHSRMASCIFASDTNNVFFGISGYGGSGLVSLDVSSNPVVNQLLLFPGNARNVSFNGDYAFVATGAGGIRILNISNPENPYEISSYTIFDTSFYDVLVNGELLYSLDDGGVRVLDISDPVNPQLVTHVGDTNFNFWESRVTLYQDYLYVVSPLSGLLVYDVSNPSHPVVVGRFSEMVRPNHIYVSGNYGYVTDGGTWYGGGGIRIFDLSDPSNPVQDTVIGEGSFVDIDGQGDFVFALSRYDLFSFNLGDPLLTLDTLGIGGAIGVGISDSLIAVTTSDFDTILIDEAVVLVRGTDPQNLQIIGYYPLMGPYDPRDVTFNNGYIYVADDAYGVWIFEYVPTSIRETPGIFSGTVVVHNGILNLPTTKVEIFDVSGRRVARVSGKTRLNLPSGVYLMRPEKQHKIMKLLIVK